MYDGELLIPKDKETQIFHVRSRINAPHSDIPAEFGGTTDYGLISHSFSNQLPSTIYGNEHPEYYALFEGRRLSNTINDLLETQPCLTNPDILKIVTAAVKERISASSLLNVSVFLIKNLFFWLCPDPFLLRTLQETWT